MTDFYLKKQSNPIEAIQLTEHNHDLVMRFCLGTKGLDGTVNVKTPEGMLIAKNTNYILKGYSDQLGYHCWVNEESYFLANYIKCEPTKHNLT